MSGINFDIGPAITEELHPKPVVQREEGKVMSEASSSAYENRLARIQVRGAQGCAEEANRSGPTRGAPSECRKTEG